MPLDINTKALVNELNRRLRNGRILRSPAYTPHCYAAFGRPEKPGLSHLGGGPGGKAAYCGKAAHKPSFASCLLYAFAEVCRTEQGDRH